MQCAGCFIDKPLLHQGARYCQLEHHGQVPSQEHDSACCDIPEEAVISQALKAGTVVGRRRSIFIQHLGQAMVSGIGDPCQASRNSYCQCGKGQDQQRMNDDAQGYQLHLTPLDLLAEVFRGPSDHQAADEHSQNGIHDHVHQADALTAEYHIEHHVQQRNHAAQRGEGIMHIVDGTCGKGSCHSCEQRRLRGTKPHLLALHAAHGLAQSQLGQQGVALAFRPEADRQADEEQNPHGGKDAAALFSEEPGSQAVAHRLGNRTAGAGLCAAVMHHSAEGDNTGTRQEHHRPELDEIGENGGIFDGGRRVGSQEAAAIGAEVLDALQRRYRTGGNDLACALHCVHHDISGEILGNALPYQQQPCEDGEGQQHPGDNTHQIAVKVAHLIGGPASQAPDKGDAGRIAAGCRYKHHKDDDQHLREIGKPCFTGVMLQVCIGHKADDCIE